MLAWEARYKRIGADVNNRLVLLLSVALSGAFLFSFLLAGKVYTLSTPATPGSSSLLSLHKSGAPDGVAATQAFSAFVPALRPYKYTVSAVTPAVLQQGRGSCWLFATAGILEQSYRSQGISRGYLSPGEYLKLSVQALGADFLKACRAARPTCIGPDDET